MSAHGFHHGGFDVDHPPMYEPLLVDGMLALHHPMMQVESAEDSPYSARELDFSHQGLTDVSTTPVSSLSHSLNTITPTPTKAYFLNVPKQFSPGYGRPPRTRRGLNTPADFDGMPGSPLKNLDVPPLSFSPRLVHSPNGKRLMPTSPRGGHLAIPLQPDAKGWDPLMSPADLTRGLLSPTRSPMSRLHFESPRTPIQLKRALESLERNHKYAS
jgi:hypothetical protein